MRRMGVDHALDVRARAQDFRMDEHLVVARHGAADLLAVEIDRDDVVGRHLVEPDGGGLHQEAMRIVRQPHRHVAGDKIALVLAREDAARIGEFLSERLGHLIFSRSTRGDTAPQFDFRRKSACDDLNSISWCRPPGRVEGHNP